MTAITNLEAPSGQAPSTRVKLDQPLDVRAVLIFLAIIAAGLFFMAFSIYSDVSEAGGAPTSILPFLLLGVAMLIALGFEFVNGFHDTANAVATVIYTHSLPANVCALVKFAKRCAAVRRLIGSKLRVAGLGYALIAAISRGAVVILSSCVGDHVRLAAIAQIRSFGDRFGHFLRPSAVCHSVKLNACGPACSPDRALHYKRVASHLAQSLWTGRADTGWLS